jgi:hypothetical protein
MELADILMDFTADITAEIASGIKLKVLFVAIYY